MRQIIQEEVEQLKRREGSEKTWNVFIKNSKKDYYRLRNELDNILSKPTSFRSRELMEAMKVLAVEENG